MKKNFLVSATTGSVKLLTDNENVFVMTALR